MAVVDGAYYNLSLRGTLAGLENSLNLSGLGYGVGISAVDKNLFMQGGPD